MSKTGLVTFVAIFLVIATVFMGAFMSVSIVFATDDYAIETGQECSVCHISASGGGGLTPEGGSYSADPDSWLPPATPRKRIPFGLKFVHMLILYAHLFFGIIWIGTILYVHLVLKPKYALGGLPRSEVRLAWISIPMLALTGVLLTIWRVRITPGLFSTMFGKLLLGKITVFLLMVSSATFVTLYVGPRLKALARKHSPAGSADGKGRFTPDELDDHDGTEGGRTLIAANGQVYDVSSSPMWKGGMHAGRHKAGQDLTEYLKNAPHDADVLKRYERVGEFVTGHVKAPPVVRIFTVNAYFNLIGCFLIVLILVLWRW
jgi:predicted heme/steroid binding protein